MFRSNIFDKLDSDSDIIRKTNIKNNNYVLSESKLAFYGLIISFIVIAAKIYHLNRKYII